MNVQRRLIREFMLYGFKQDHKIVEAIKNICFAKGEGGVKEKFRSSRKNLDDQARSGRPKTIDFEDVLLSIAVNPVSNTWRVSGELVILQFRVVNHLHNLGKSIPCCQIVSHITKIL